MTMRLSPAEDALLRDFTARLLALVPAGAVRAVTVFGSRARGDSNEYSDLDVAILAAPGVDCRHLRDVVADVATTAEAELDAYDLMLAPVVVPDGPLRALRGAIARDGIMVWPVEVA